MLLFCQRLLEYPPDKRITASDALQRMCNTDLMDETNCTYVSYRRLFR